MVILANPAKYETGTFKQGDFELLSGRTREFTTTETVGTLSTNAGVVKQLFPGAPTNTKILDALGLSQYAGYAVEMKSDHEFANLYDLNQFSGNIGVTFTVRNSEKALITTVSTSLQVQNYAVNVGDIVANLGDTYDAAANVSGTNPFGVAMDVQVVSTLPAPLESNKLYVVVPVDADQPANYFTDAAYLVAAGTGKAYNKLLNTGLPQMLSVSYLNGNGDTITKNVQRNITVNATAETTPLIQVKEADGPFGTEVYYINGQKVGMEYAYQMEALKQAPLGGAEDYIKTNLWGTTPANGFKILNDNNDKKDKFVLVPFAGSKGGDVKALYAEKAIDLNALTNDENISIDASNVDFTKAGTYYYSVSVTNAQGVTGTFELPLIIKTTAKAPTYKFAPGFTANMVIKKGDSFKPFEGLTFYQTDNAKDGEITQKNITVEGSVTTNVAGTYTLVYEIAENTRYFSRVDESASVVG